MSEGDIAIVRRLLGAKPRPAGWAERRARIVEVGAAMPVAADRSRVAGAAAAADIAATLEIWPHMIHAVPLWKAQLADARSALARAGAFLRSHRP